MVAPISAVGAAGVSPLADLARTRATAPTQSAQSAGEAFGGLVNDGLRNVSALEHTADAMVQDVATGGPTRIEDVMIATTQAQLGLEMLAKVRDRALEAYQEVMRMPL